MANRAEVVEERPRTGEEHADAPRRHLNAGRDFDQAHPPRAGVTFAKRVCFPAAVEASTARTASACFNGNSILVEIIAGDDTSQATMVAVDEFVDTLGKTAVRSKDTPAFIVNRVARPFYGEALRLLGESAADVTTIDRLVRSLGFRMGPFELIDLVGSDVNLEVTTSVYNQFYHDAKYRPHPIQKRMVASGRLGRKSGRGFYDYRNNSKQ